MLYFVDTSALIKRYISEVGSSWVLSWMLPSAGNIITISQLTTVEIISALARRQRAKHISLAAFNRHKNNFLLHLDKEYLMLAVEEDVWSLARDLVLKHPLRTLDALQLASAMKVSQLLQTTPTFISADVQLLATAQAEGFPVDDPNAHA